MRHLSTAHRQVPVVCKYNDKCIRTFSCVTKLKKHIENDHRAAKKNVAERSGEDLIEFALKCEFAHCGEIHQGKKKLLEHYKLSHKKAMKPCPFDGCSTIVEAFPSLMWHIKKNMIVGVMF